VRVFLGSIVAHLLLNPYVFLRGWQALGPKKRRRIPFALFFVLELLAYFCGFFFYKELPDGVLQALLFGCGAWYVCLLYLSMALLALDMLRLSNRLRPWFPAFVTLHWQRVKQGLFVLVTLGLCLLMCQAYLNVSRPVVTHVNIDLNKAAGNGRDSLTIVMMTDLHIGEIVGKSWVQHYVALSNAQRPDMVVLVGDLLDYESLWAERAHIEEDLRRLQAPLGVFAVNGNHEYRANRHAKQLWIRQTGSTLLIDSTVCIDHSFYLIGRDDYINKARQPLHALMQGIDATLPILLLDHQPWTLPEQTMNGVDLALHGHTHNGQLWPYPLAMKFIYECPYGYYRRGPTQGYVSSGIGIAGPPFRVGTRSELVVLHIRFH